MKQFLRDINVLSLLGVLWAGGFLFLSLTAPLRLEDYSLLLSYQRAAGVDAVFLHGFGTWLAARILPLVPLFLRLALLALWFIALRQIVQALQGAGLTRVGVVIAAVVFSTRSIHLDSLTHFYGFSVVLGLLGTLVWWRSLLHTTDVPRGKAIGGFVLALVNGYEAWLLAGMGVISLWYGPQARAFTWSDLRWRRVLGSLIVAAGHGVLVLTGVLAPYATARPPGMEGAAATEGIVNAVKWCFDVLFMRQLVQNLLVFRITPGTLFSILGFAALLALFVPRRGKHLVALGVGVLLIGVVWAGLTGDRLINGFSVIGTLGLAVVVGAIGEGIWARVEETVPPARWLLPLLLVPVLIGSANRAAGLPYEPRATMAQGFQELLIEYVNYEASGPTPPRHVFVFGFAGSIDEGRFEGIMNFVLGRSDLQLYLVDAGNPVDVYRILQLPGDDIAYVEYLDGSFTALPELGTRLRSKDAIDRFVRLVEER